MQEPNLRRRHHYTLFIDEAGDDKLDALKPERANGNSEWLCIGGYLIRSELEADLTSRRDTIRRAIGGKDGQVLHYRDLIPKNRLIATKTLASPQFPARGYVVCSCKRTMLGYRNPRAEAALGEPHKDTLYNYACRILLERVTHFVAEHGKQRGIEQPKLRIVLASRRGHHFGQFKAYLMAKLVPQAIGGTTFQDKRVLEPNVISRDLIERLPASQEPGLQLADTLVSAFFQSLEQASPHYQHKTAKSLRHLMARRRPRYPSQTTFWNNEGVTLYHPSAAKILTPDQRDLLEFFGYDIAWLAAHKPKKPQYFTQAERLWSNSRHNH